MICVFSQNNQDDFIKSENSIVFDREKFLNAFEQNRSKFKELNEMYRMKFIYSLIIDKTFKFPYSIVSGRK